MAVNVGLVRVSANTSTGTQDITKSGFGTPKAAIFIVNKATTDGSNAASMNMSYGAATGASNEWCITGNSKDNVGTTETKRSGRTTRCIRIDVDGTVVVDGDALFTSFITDGVRIDWQTAPSAAWLVTVILLGGTDLTAKADNVNLGNSLDNLIDVTTVGFESDVLFAACQGSLAADANGSGYEPSMGLIHNNGAGTIRQRCGAWNYTVGNAISRGYARVTETYGIMEITTSATVDWGGDFSDFDSSGFSVTTKIAGANNVELYYLALNFGGVNDSWVGTHDTPTSTGNDSLTAIGFKPQLIFEIMSQTEAIDTANANTALAGAFGLSVYTTSDEFSASVLNDIDLSTTDTNSSTDSLAVELQDDTGTLDLEATLVSFDATGDTLNWTSVDANAKKFFRLALEENAAAGVDPITPLATKFRQARFSNIRR